MFYKRKFLSLIFGVALGIICLLSACSPIKEDKTTEQEREEPPYESVNFIDLENGEAIFVLFSDGKSMLIDCGKDQSDGEKIVEYLKAFEVSVIDYLVLTHPDQEHTGGAETVIQEFSIGKAFIPKFFEDLMPLFPSFYNAVTLLVEDGVQTVKSECYKHIKGDDYSVLFLSPTSGVDGPYAEFNGSESPTSAQADDLCPIIYLDIKGVRFLFTGDASSSQEKSVVQNCQTQIFNKMLENLGVTLKLENIDFLKVSDGGDKGGTCAEFANLLKAENAVVFVGDGKFPEGIVINNLWQANNEYDLFRTDVYGTISVKIDGDGLYTIITDKE